MTRASRTRRILLVTRNLPPLVGGMERLNWHMAEELAKVADVRIIGPEGAAALAPKGVQVREVTLKPLRRFLWQAYRLARREAKCWRPDVVLAGSGLTAPLVRAAARQCRAQTVVYVHGLDITVKHPVYRTLWLPAIRRMDRVIANSHATARLCREIHVDPARTGIVHPGVDLPPVMSSPPAGNGVDAVSRPSVEDGSMNNDFRIRHHLEDRPLLLSVGRLSARKGLQEFVSQALPYIVARQPRVMLLIVGDAPNQALHAQAQTPASIQAAADAAGTGKHLKFLGTITDYAELGAVYCAADIHVFPVRRISGDPEGFGMVAVEAAAHGLPTVAFATGGIVDAVAEGKSGHLVAANDYACFADTVVRTLAERDVLRTSSMDFAKCFSWPEFGVHLVAQLDRVVPTIRIGGGTP